MEHAHTTASKRLESAANVAIIVTTIVICVAIIKTYLIPKSPPKAARVAAAGMVLPSGDFGWKKGGRTLLIAVSPECRFCSESAPFYRRLVAETAANDDVRLVAVTNHDAVETRRYLADLNVPIRDVRRVSFQSMGVRGTPTLILVSSEGVITDVWPGKIPGDREGEVLRRLRGTA